MTIYVIFDSNLEPVGYVRTEEEANRICQEVGDWCWSEVGEMEP